MSAPIPTAECCADLEALREQLPRLRDPRARARTLRAIRRLEWELAPGRGREAEALRRLDLKGAAR